MQASEIYLGIVISSGAGFVFGAAFYAWWHFSTKDMQFRHDCKGIGGLVFACAYAAGFLASLVVLGIGYVIRMCL